MIERRCNFELAKAQKRRHLVEGFLVAMKNVDAVVAAIRAASDASEASEALQSGWGMSKEQAEGVLNLSLRRLTSMEENKLSEEEKGLSSR